MPFISRGQLFGLSLRGFFFSLCGFDVLFLFAGFYANAQWILKFSTLADIWTPFNQQNEHFENACAKVHIESENQLIEILEV